ncbi:MAG: MglA3, partial [Chloroflexi bacterium]|nr:MglA3 [Chloroflexota bacterium]
MDKSSPVLRLEHITKRFPGVLANDDVTIELGAGEILAILGENGAGKSTLMNILSGLYHPDEGRIIVDGKPVSIQGPGDAIALGIGMVHQHFELVPPLTVAENIILGQEPGTIFVDRRRAAALVRDLSTQFGLELNPYDRVADLSVGLQQRVEIVKALYRSARILILDEPTAVLTPQEARELFGIMRKLAADGRSLIFISHKLDEVRQISDRIVVMRGGRVVGETHPSEATNSTLATMMVGRPVVLEVDRGKANPGSEVLTVRDLVVRGDLGTTAIDGLAFAVRSGEIFGIAGVDGNGQAELEETLTGVRKALRGSVRLLGQELLGRSPQALIESGVACIPSDRHRRGMIGEFTVSENLVLKSFRRPPYSLGPLLRLGAITEAAQEAVKRFDVRTPSVTTKARFLSGGNQQKLVVAREMGQPARLLVAAQPTRGVDVGAIEFIYKHTIAQRDAGVAVLLISASLDEILALSDTIGVMYRGRMMGILSRSEANAELLGLMMAGASLETARREATGAATPAAATIPAEM